MHIEMNRLVCLATWCLISCTGVTPSENFKNNLQRRVGRSFDIPRTDITPELLLSTRVLGSGNIEYRYRYLGDCVQIYEVDPKTRIILRADAEGSATSCILPP